MLSSLYLEHLSNSDLAFLGAAGESRYDVRRAPLEALIDSPQTFRALFTMPGRDPLLRGSPFLIFAVLVHRVVRDLGQASFIEEWVGPRQRVPVFDTGSLRDFGADPLRRLFLAELLASYTNVASGSTMVKTTRGWRRRRFSELDPLRLIELAELVPQADRPSVYRRLGDLSLFLTGIFPDYAGERLVAERALASRVRQRFDIRKHKTLATLRKDGSPRISGIEVEFADGELFLGMMPGSLKLYDLERDPRLALHSPTEDPPPGNSRGWPGEAKLAGYALEVRFDDSPVAGGRRFRIDITEAVLTRLNNAGDQLVIESWHPGKGARKFERS